MTNSGAGRKNAVGDLAKRFWIFSREQPLGAVGIFILLTLAILAVAADLAATKSPTATNISQALAPPSSQFLFGSDFMGRDMWSRWVYGSRTSLVVAGSAVLLASSVGGLIGIISGLVGGHMDSYIQRFMDVLLAMPGIVKAIIIMAVLGTSVVNVIIAITISYSPRMNRLTRGVAISVKESVFVESARIAGASTWRITIRHIAPNCMAAWMVYGSALLATAFLAEASLSFLNLGVPPPAPSWGRDLSDNISRFELAPWLCIFPGLGISLAIFGANFVGDAMRNILDPRLKRI